MPIKTDRTSCEKRFLKRQRNGLSKRNTKTATSASFHEADKAAETCWFG